ncbi:hypothetical protein ACK2M7_05865 [Chryseobacterium sp. TY4]
MAKWLPKSGFHYRRFFDNLAMLRIMDKLGYQYCEEIFVGGGVRKAFEKVLS